MDEIKNEVVHEETVCPCIRDHLNCIECKKPTLASEEEKCPRPCTPCPDYTVYDLCNCTCERNFGCVGKFFPCGVPKISWEQRYETFGNANKPTRKCLAPKQPNSKARVTNVKSFCIVPDVLSTLPEELCTVRFPSGARANQGNRLKLCQVSQQPHVAWRAELNVYYCVCMFDPDAQSTTESKRCRMFLHWMVENIKGNNTFDLNVPATYLPPTLCMNSEPHRYIVLVYQQPGHIQIKEKWVTMEERANFNLHQFTLNYDLKNPVAGNFFTV